MQGTNRTQQAMAKALVDRVKLAVEGLLPKNGEYVIVLALPAPFEMNTVASNVGRHERHELLKAATAEANLDAMQISV